MRNPSALERLALALVLSVLAGVALAGLALPLVGGVGLVGKAASDRFQPEKPPDLVLPQRTTITDRNGTTLATLFTEDRITVKLSQVPLLTQKALIAIEDSRFYEHKALDVKGTLRALALNSSSGSVQQGGSTLTQQYVKNLLIETADTDAGKKDAAARTTKRKLQEARYAIYLEQHMTKDQILTGYLNIAYYDSGVYGIGAAARHYFSKDVSRLTPDQGALLAGMVQNPTRFDPIAHPVDARKRRNVVLDRMHDLGYLTLAQVALFKARRLGTHVTNTKSGCEASGVTAPFFCDYIRRYLEDGPAGAALGDTRQARQERLLSGGLTIRTTLDPKAQAAAQQAVDKEVPARDPFGAAAVSDTVVPGTGEVRAMAVDRGYGTGRGQTKVNLAIGGSYGFQGGSTFKAFVLAAALQQEIPTSLTLNSPSRYCPTAFKYVAGDGKCGPRNAGDSESGRFDMVRATWDSVNTYFIQLEEKTGIAAPVQAAEALGIRDVNGTFAGGSIDQNPSFVFGTAGPHGYSPLAVASAYAAFAAQGRYCPPQPIMAITDARGAKITLPPDSVTCSQAITPEVANKVTGLLRGVIDGNGARTGGDASIGRPAAGKTGTTNSSTAAWFVGYTPQLATAVWVGKPLPEAMTDVRINGTYYKQVYGGTIPAAIFREVMLGALDGVPVQDFPDAPLIPPTQAQSFPRVPSVIGLSPAAAAAALASKGYTAVVGAEENGGPVAAGLVSSTSPGAGARLAPGGAVTLHPSNGLPPLITPPVPGQSPTPSPGTAPPTAPSKAPAPSAKPQPTKTKKP